jgi:hypothetical protein
MSNAAQIVIVLVGVLVPTAFVLFVISVTRRDKEFKKIDGLFSAIARLHKELHRAFAADKEHTPSKQ